MLMSITVLLLTSPWGWAQGSASQTSAASVDEAFSSFHQALCATANDLLASAQRPTEAVHPRLDASPGSDLSFVSTLRVEEKTRQNVKLQQAVERVQGLRSVLEPILREEGVPQQLAAVVLVESGGTSTALSAKGARGLWQFMPDTARRYGLVVTASSDERLDPYKSTHAAARYLRDLYTQFGNWPLALAAYNAGEDAVQRAVERTSSHDFNSIARLGVLPLETRSYVPAVLNAIGLIATGGRDLPTAEQSAGRAVVYTEAKWRTGNSPTATGAIGD
jgi:soluble lytic murein transglycosylase-like protein